MDYSVIASSVKSAASIRRFVEGGDLKKAIDAIGSLHLESASYRLSRLHLAVDKKAQARGAADDLMTAHVAFEKLHRRNAFTQTFRAFSRYEAARKDFWTCCLIVTCYLYCGERLLAADALELVAESWQSYKEDHWTTVFIIPYAAIGMLTDTRMYAEGRAAQIEKKIHPRSAQHFYTMASRMSGNERTLPSWD